jgi:transcriptional regulator with XRE-family HTH domain
LLRGNDASLTPGAYSVKAARERAEGQPSADVLKRMAVALHVTADFLLFDEHERGPDTDLTLQFEAVNQFSKEEKHVVRELLGGLILEYEARRWNNRTPEQGRYRSAGHECYQHSCPADRNQFTWRTDHG